MVERATVTPFPVLFDEPELRDRTTSVAARHPAVGLAVAVVRLDSPDRFGRHGLADIASGRQIDADTVFRIGSLTKPITAVAVMQLHEQGLVDLDAPVGRYLRAYRLVPARRGLRQPTVRHLLTHTAGIPEVRRLSDLLHVEAGPLAARPALPSVPFGAPMPPLAHHYRHGLRVVADPGTVFAYSNHGYATLGQIIEDVTGTPLDRYLRERIFEPLGMTATSLLRGDELARHLATGYVVGRHGVRAAPDRDWAGAGCGGIYSTPRDMARFTAAVLEGLAGRDSGVLQTRTLRTMVEPHFRPDPRLPGWGLGFARGEVAGHRVAGHDGVLPGFNSVLMIAPDDGVGVVALTNGSAGALAWLQDEATDLMRRLLGPAGTVTRTEVPHRPEIWGDLCGRYRLPPRISDLRGRAALPGGVEVHVRGGHLRMRALTPVPALVRGFPLVPADAADPYAFRLDLSSAGLGGATVMFGRDVTGGRTAVHTDLGGQPLSLIGRPVGAGARAPSTG